MNEESKLILDIYCNQRNNQKWDPEAVSVFDELIKHCVDDRIIISPEAAAVLGLLSIDGHTNYRMAALVSVAVNDIAAKNDANEYDVALPDYVNELRGNIAEGEDVIPPKEDDSPWRNYPDYPQMVDWNPKSNKYEL